jgi:hypothetical protein
MPDFPQDGSDDAKTSEYWASWQRLAAHWLLGAVPAQERRGRNTAQPVASLSTSTQSGAGTASAPTLPTVAAKKRISRDLTLKGDSAWIDTGIDIAPGEHLVATAKGSYAALRDAQKTIDKRMTAPFPRLQGSSAHSSIQRRRTRLLDRPHIGDADTAQPFLIGASHDIVPPVGGRPALRSISTNDTGEGSYTVHIDVIATDTNASQNLPL